MERFHRTLDVFLEKLISERQKDWDIHLTYVMAVYRATEHEPTHETPNFLFLGRQNHAPVGLYVLIATVPPE